MKKETLMRDLVLPAAVLTVIALLATAALAFTNALTKPTIEGNQLGASGLARLELLPDADKFVKVEPTEELAALGVVDVYTAENKAGTVITVTEAGYGGEFTLMVAFNPDGAVVAYKPLEHDETKGLGSQVFESPFADQFAGKTAGALEVIKGSAGKETEIAAVANATISSKAVTLAVNHAGEALAILQGGGLL